MQRKVGLDECVAAWETFWHGVGDPKLDGPRGDAIEGRVG